jgi:hypothetical protein
MRLSDETLIAYADGELDENTRGQVEQAMQADPGVAARVRQHQALRGGGSGGPGGARPQAPARPKVIHLDSVRVVHAARAPKGARSAPVAPPPHWTLPQWAALAATLLLGIAGGILAVSGYHSETQFAAVGGSGLLRAHGKLESALDRQMASAPQPRGHLRIGVSFVGRDGQYCRAFELGAAAGLACRAGAGWNIPVLVEGQGASGGYRPVGSPLPPAVLAAIDARAVGPALDGAAEKAAAARAWSR